TIPFVVPLPEPRAVFVFRHLGDAGTGFLIDKGAALRVMYGNPTFSATRMTFDVRDTTVLDRPLYCFDWDNERKTFVFIPRADRTARSLMIDLEIWGLPAHARQVAAHGSTYSANRKWLLWNAGWMAFEQGDKQGAETLWGQARQAIVPAAVHPGAMRERE